MLEEIQTTASKRGTAEVQQLFQRAVAANEELKAAKVRHKSAWSLYRKELKKLENAT
jgi:hypothetical protein